ncbi:endoribonuclease VapD [Desulfosporosinus sp. BICA1-9]|uniref:endoribonuclease VapD n=1 Tax=Desulfosporosinus sp. BICA1-9 TaxID=1531958 RepID=UPI00054C585B|nr:endoribonuclease VapD [Desulfosporosinus sp. BICA1-9]KJS49237.1 MAG: endoribonuclease VapD [Peptococcaceae bacterium BRH_c23]KJS84936.1 MAG: endoribonuclease VapD [Desulfosporosinus sp. BICA1-9]HBW34583.1 hypothetical protein [Desulfosporosinus sp.]
MYALAFELQFEELKKHYGDWDEANLEIRRELEALGFEWIQASLYISNNENDLMNVYKAISKLRRIDWFKKSVRDVRAFEVEDWSNFTEFVKID